MRTENSRVIGAVRGLEIDHSAHHVPGLNTRPTVIMKDNPHTISTHYKWVSPHTIRAERSEQEVAGNKTIIKTATLYQDQLEH
ncbi:hypothetical protein [Gimesia aquarii]|uniref:Uncharacterized protein n=1 Tax=Gimesia aquarii TaxID=2527964 RepID=A0A517VYW6_9PLAN|nr:hypothetical protein [Gimesia aquarii]QDT98192.1 hypothetical protein V144x_36780 [Gimesia aquarii]